VKKSIDFGFDDHQGDDERGRVSWVVAIADDCDTCEDIRVDLTVEEEGRAGAGLVAHLAPDTARKLVAAVNAALKEVGEKPG
jgi:hypothetical protein